MANNDGDYGVITNPGTYDQGVYWYPTQADALAAYQFESEYCNPKGDKSSPILIKRFTVQVEVVE